MENKYKFTKEHTQVAKGVALLLMLFDHFDIGMVDNNYDSDLLLDRLEL